jgi:hypothetical protein
MRPQELAQLKMEHSYWLNLQKRALLGLHQGPSSRTNNDVVTYMALFWHHILGPAQEEEKNARKMKTQLLGQDPKLYHFFIQYF